MGPRFSAPVQTGSAAQPVSCTMGTWSFQGVKNGRGVTLNSHHFYCRGHERLELYLYSLLWTVRPVQSLSVCTVQLYLYSLLWAVRPVESLSACKVQLYLYSPYGPYGLYRASVPVQYSYTSTPPMGRTACTEPQWLYNTAIPLLPSVPVQYSYTSSPPKDRMAFTEPQWL